ncbi:MAG TPA: peptidoglycan DD-metalloendopeptidase family protein [Armatimonadota bacterium]|nr:peptidoglycan DD-metalloendopeptidase family protein [Armatimonadota bacterium]
MPGLRAAAGAILALSFAFVFILATGARCGAAGVRHHPVRHHAARRQGPRRPRRRGITRTEYVRKRRQLRKALVTKQTIIQQQQSHLQALVQRGVALSKQIHQDELAEEDASNRLSDAQFHLKQVNDDLCASLIRLAAARRRLALDRANLTLRLRDVYEEGNVGILQALLYSRNIIDFMNRREYVRRVAQHDLGIVRRVRIDQDEIAAESRELALQRAQKASQVNVIQYQAQRLNDAIYRRAAILQATEQQSESARESLAEMETQSASIQAMLFRLQSTPILTVAGPNGRPLRYHLHLRGRFIMPAIGPITSPFGYRYHPILHVYKLHTGVDIGAPWGSMVRAAAAGVVVHAGWLGAYGNGIIIDHGDGLATLYGHLSRIEVTVGEAVGQGQPIGAVGSTGLSTGPHLHFEVRKYGTPVPPF